MSWGSHRHDWDRFVEDDMVETTFRGVRALVIPHLQRVFNSNWLVQKSLSQTVIYDLLKRSKTWEPAVWAAEDFAHEVKRNPRPYCEPPKFADDWNVFRKDALDYAPNVWWFETLELEDLVKASTWQSSLSRSTAPRKWPEIRERAVAWRERVEAGLARWEQNVLYRDEWHDMKQTWIKDELDAKGELAAIKLLTHINSTIPFTVDDYKADYRGVYFDAYFDPAHPEARQFTTARDDPKAAQVELAEMIADGFKRYRADDPQPDKVERVQRPAGWCSDDYRWEWTLLTEFERRSTWNPKLRCMDYDDRPIRVRVRADVSMAKEGEEIRGRQVREMVDVIDEFGRRRGSKRVDRVEQYVWRWRAVDEYDNRGETEGRDRVLMIAGATGTDPTLQFYMEDAAPPIEQRSADRRYTVD